MTELEFIENTCELAFGDDAVRKGYTYDEVYAMLREFSDKALAFDEAGLDINDNNNPDYCPR